MTHQKQHPGFAVNSITFFNPPYNSPQATVVNQQHLQQTAARSSPHISNPSSPTVGTPIETNVQRVMQAHHFPSTIHLQQQSSPQFFHLYTSASVRNPHLTIIPSFAPILTNTPPLTVVKDVNVVSSSTNTSSSTAVKGVNVVSSSLNTSPLTVVKGVNTVSSSSNTSSSTVVKDADVISSSSNISPSTVVKDLNVVSPSSNTSSSNSPRIDSTPTTSTDNKRAQRLARNRLAARECRERRKAYILNLENRTSKLEDDNLILRKKIQELKTKLGLMEYINQDNIRLENLVRELKRKVTEPARDGTDNCASVIKDCAALIDEYGCIEVKMEQEDF